MSKLNPDNLIDMIKLKMFEKGLSQRDLARLLSEPESRISELLNNKRKLTMKVAKSLYKKLDISADFILTHV